MPGGKKQTKGKAKGDWIDFAKWNLDWIQDQIKRADEKANIHLAVYLALTGVFIAHLATYVGLVAGCKNINTMGWLLFLIGGVFAFCIFFLVHFYYHFYNILRPRINYKHLVGEDYCSFCFWGGIATLKYEEFKEEYQSRYEIMEEDLKKQIYINSVIANEKYMHFIKAIKFFPWAVLAIAAFVFLVYWFKGG